MINQTAKAPPARFNFAEHLLTVNAERGARVAYIDDRTQLTYAALAERVRRFATVLEQCGLRREERLLLLAHDTVDWPIAFLGSLYAGIVPVAVNTLLTVDDYAYMLAHSRAHAAIVGAPLAPTLQQAMERGSHNVETLFVIGASGALPRNARDFAADVERASPKAGAAPTHEPPAFGEV